MLGGVVVGSGFTQGVGFRHVGVTPIFWQCLETRRQCLFQVVPGVAEPMQVPQAPM